MSDSDDEVISLQKALSDRILDTREQLKTQRNLEKTLRESKEKEELFESLISYEEVKRDGIDNERDNVSTPPPVLERSASATSFEKISADESPTTTTLAIRTEQRRSSNMKSYEASLRRQIEEHKKLLSTKRDRHNLKEHEYQQQLFTLKIQRRGRRNATVPLKIEILKKKKRTMETLSKRNNSLRSSYEKQQMEIFDSNVSKLRYDLKSKPINPVVVISIGNLFNELHLSVVKIAKEQGLLYVENSASLWLFISDSPIAAVGFAKAVQEVSNCIGWGLRRLEETNGVPPQLSFGMSLGEVHETSETLIKLDKDQSQTQNSSPKGSPGKKKSCWVLAMQCIEQSRNPSNVLKSIVIKGWSGRSFSTAILNERTANCGEIVLCRQCSDEIKDYSDVLEGKGGYSIAQSKLGLNFILF